MEKNRIRGYSVLGIIFVVFTVISFIVPFEKNAVFAISYICGVISILLQLYFSKKLFSKKQTPKEIFYNIPIAKIQIIYLITQVVFSFVEMAMSTIIPIWIVIIANAIIIALTMLGYIANETTKDEIIRQEKTENESVSNIKKLQIMSLRLKNKCNNQKTKKIIEKLVDFLQYADPVTSNATINIENEIINIMTNILELLEKEDFENANLMCEKIIEKLEERNNICKLSK